MAERINLGSSEIKISPLGIGTWAWGDRLMWRSGKTGHYTQADVRAAFDEAIAAGINFFDTAEVYGLGRSERLLGSFVRQSGASVVIASKFFPFPWRLTKRAFRRALRHTLARLGVEQVDLYQIHFPYPPVPIETWMDAMAEAVEAGLIRAVGVSNYNAEQLGRAYNALSERGIKLASNQVFFSLLHRTPEQDGVRQLCRDLNVTMIAYSPLEKGMLTGKYTPTSPPSGLRKRMYPAWYLARIQPLLNVMREIETRRGKTLPQIALNWVICKGAVPIPGAKNARQASSNLEALGWRLSDDEITWLDEASEGLTELRYRGKPKAS